MLPCCHASYTNTQRPTDPKSNSDFTQQAIPSSVGKIVSGHQCYKLNAPPSTVKAGDDATIQLKYRSKFPGENNGNDQTFYACADIVSIDVLSLSRRIHRPESKLG